MAGVAISDVRQNFYLVRNFPAGAVGNSSRADEIDVQRQVRTVLLNRAAGDDADLLLIDSVLNFRPGQFFLSMLLGDAVHRDLAR